MKSKSQISASAFEFKNRIPFRQAIPLSLQHVLAMFGGNLTPVLIMFIVTAVETVDDISGVMVDGMDRKPPIRSLPAA